MCGVIGFYHPCPGQAEFSLLEALFRESAIRGTHAFGFSYVTPALPAIQTFKAATLTGNGLIAALRSTAKLVQGQPVLLVGHNRYSTSGDWQTLSNNQPLVIGGDSGDMALAFNGTLDMSDPAAWPKAYGLKFETSNDGEIYLRQLEAGAEPVAALKTHRGTFAGTVLRGSADGSYEVIALRNKMRPLWAGADATGGRYIASTQDIFKRTGYPIKPNLIPEFKLLTLGKVQVVDADHRRRRHPK